jgi:AcrR family transcriptional regulator
VLAVKSTALICDILFGMTAPSLRARVRAEMIEEIKQTARRHLADGGSSNLSLRAVTRDLGMVSSAVYRYFASRDELLTALIIDAYNSLGEACEQAEAQLHRTDLLGRFQAIFVAVREWALASPHEYALIYGSPVPGYAAPEDTIGPAARPTILLSQILSDGYGAGILRHEPGEWLTKVVHAEMMQVTSIVAPGVPTTLMARGMLAWTELFGAVSFELFGRLNNVIDDKAAWFDHQVRAMARLVGLRP